MRAYESGAFKAADWEGPAVSTGVVNAIEVIYSRSATDDCLRSSMIFDD